MGLAEIRHPEGGVVNSAVRLNNAVVGKVAEFAHHGPDHARAFQLELNVLTAGYFISFAVGFSVEFGLEAFLQEIGLPDVGRSQPVVAPGLATVGVGGSVGHDDGRPGRRDGDQRQEDCEQRET
jgi:hypothetical protein